MPRKYLNQCRDGDAVDEVYLMAEKQLRANRNADLYLLATLRDKTGTLNGLMWNVTEESVADVNSGDFVRVRGKVQMYQGGLQMIMTGIRAASLNGLDLQDFHPETNVQVQQLLTQVRATLESIEDPWMQQLMTCFMDDEELMAQFAKAPAGIKAHHAYHGGLLEHVCNMLLAADRIIDLYPAIDRGLLLAGIFLHDLGKVREMAYETSFVYSDEGQLLGHMLIAIEILNQKIQIVSEARQEPFPEETVWRLKHMILSHHGEYEFGSPKLPMTLEAIALHYLDNLDAKVHEFSRLINEDPSGQSHWTPYQPRLERKLFKGKQA